MKGEMIMTNESFRNRKNGFETVNGGSFGDNKNNGWKKPISIIAVVVVLLILAFNSTYQIGEQEQAVLITLGKAQAVTEPGLHFKIPFIQQVKKVNTTIQGFAIGYDSSSNDTLTDESLMITSDYNFVNVDFFVEYRYSDPVKAIYASEDPAADRKSVV